MVVRRVALGVVVLAACARAPVTPGSPVPELRAIDTHGAEIDVRAAARDANVTVIEMFSAHCPCQRVHDKRLEAMFEEYEAKGVRFFAIDAERGASPERAKAEAAARGYRFPLLADPSGGTARALGAEAATHTVVLDREGRIRYSGGIDSDRVNLTDDARLYVHDAVEDLLAGREPRVTVGRTLGCALER